MTIELPTLITLALQKKDLKKLLVDLKDEPYSLYSVDKILDKIDLITTTEEFKSSNAYAQQNITLDKLNIDFIVEKRETFIIEKINILGNNITQENVYMIYPFSYFTSLFHSHQTAIVNRNHTVYSI